MTYRRMKDGVLSWYRMHSLREQQFIALLAAIVGGTIIFYGLWKPLQQQVNSAVHSYRDNRDLLQWVQVNARQIKIAPTTSGGDNEEWLRGSAQEQGFTVNALESDKDGKITVKLSQAAFDGLLTWVLRLGRDNGLMLDSMSLTRAIRPGIVDATLILRRSS